MPGGIRSGRFSSAERWWQQPAIPCNEEEVIEQIGGILKKWGINSNTNETHASFEERVKTVTANCFAAKVVQKWKPFDSSVALPADTIESLKILLHHNLMQVTKGGTEHSKTETNDMIKDRYDAFLPFPPFNVVRGGYLVLSPPYKELSLSEEELDPLVRFTYTERSMKDYMHEQFSQAPTEEYPSHFVRALTVHEIVKRDQPCLSCGEKGSLRWNSALRSDFCNIICVRCNSVYCLSCIAGTDKVRKAFKKRSHFRGSYAHFQQLRSLMDKTGDNGSKMFLLFATRSADANYQYGNKKLPVYAAQIMGAQPNLNSDSFSSDRIRIKSNVVFEPMLDKTAWFSVDIPDDLDVVAMSMEVFHAYFDTPQDKTLIQPIVSKVSVFEREMKVVEKLEQLGGGNK